MSLRLPEHRSSRGELRSWLEPPSLGQRLAPEPPVNNLGGIPSLFPHLSLPKVCLWCQTVSDLSSFPEWRGLLLAVISWLWLSVALCRSPWVRQGSSSSPISGARGLQSPPEPSSLSSSHPGSLDGILPLLVCNLTGLEDDRSRSGVPGEAWKDRGQTSIWL